MSYQMWVDQDPYYKVRWYNTSSTGSDSCTWVQPPELSTALMWQRYHEVTSWRGKREELRVGSKRRQVFRAFEVRKQELSHRDGTWKWCPIPGKVARGVGNTPYRLLKTWEWMTQGKYESAWSGSKLPTFSYSDHKSIGDSLRDDMILQLWAKAKEPRYDSAVFLAELGETLVSLRALFLGCVKAFAKSGAAVKSLKHMTLNSEELWLWYRYFLIPTMLDAQDLLEAIKPQARIDRIQSGRTKENFQCRGTIYAHGWWGSQTYEIPWYQNITVSTGCAMDLTKRLDTSQWGTSAVDVMRAGWEVIPFSFVFDWFVNVSDFLTTLRDVELEIAQTYATFAVESHTTLLAGPNISQSKNPMIRTVAVERIIDLEPPFHPGVNDSFFNLMRTIDSIALATGMIKNILSRGKRRK